MTTLATRPHDRAGCYSRHRASEWGTSLAMLGDGVLFSLSPRSISDSAFAPLLDIASIPVLAALFLITGTMRIAALYGNGAFPVIGPMTRAIGAVIGAVAWASMGIALFLQVIHFGRAPSPGIPVYLALLAMEMHSAYRAASDVRSRL